MNKQNLELDQIRLDPKAQPRVGTHTDVVEQYALEMGEGANFPPLIVFHDGKTYWLADGFHRHYAAKALGLAEYECDVREGGLREAILFSCSANSTHGLRRTNDDKRRAVKALLNDPEWCQWSDREISRRCGVDHKTVSNLRPKLTGDFPSDSRTYTTKHGSQATMNTANIGSNQPDKPVFDDTETGERQQIEKPDPVAIWTQETLKDYGYIYDALGEMHRQFKKLPPPEQAAINFPKMLKHTFSADDAQHMANWLFKFSNHYEGVSNVAAE